MNKFSKTILTGLILGAAISWISFQPVLGGDPLTVEFEQDPLFSDGDIKPGDSVTRWVKVTNHYYDDTKKIAVEAINYPDPVPVDDLSRALNIVIKNDATELYSDSLYNFYLAGETYLSDIGPEETIQYDFTVLFPAEKEDEWQSKTTGFDILIGFQGEDGGNGGDGGDDGDDGDDGDGGGGGGTSGGGGVLPPGLTILDESVFTTCTESCEAIVNWTTNYFSTSQVIFATENEAHILDLTDISGTPPKFGYAQTSPEYDDDPKVTAHTVTLSGLTPNTIYYFRAVSHASPHSISLQHQFSTGDCSKLYSSEEPGESSGPTESESGEPSNGKPAEEKPGEIVFGPTEPSETSEPGNEVEEPGEGEEEEKPSLIEITEGKESAWMNFLASLRDILDDLMKCYSCLPWWLILVFALYPAIKVLAIDKERKREFPIISRKLLQQQELTWIGWILVLAGLAVYFYQRGCLCVDIWIFLLLALATLVIDFFLLKKEQRTMPLFSKQNFKFLLGVAIVIIFFIIWYFMSCIPLWVIAFLIVIYFLASDLFKRKMK